MYQSVIHGGDDTSLNSSGFAAGMSGGAHSSWIYGVGNNVSGSSASYLTGTQSSGVLHGTTRGQNMQAFLDDERAIAAAAAEGLTLATRGRIHETMEPFRARAQSDSRREIRGEIGGFLRAAGLLFGDNRRKSFSALSKQGA